MGDEKDIERAGRMEREADQPTGAEADRPGPGWRAWILSILAAVILSVAATLLLGGSFGVSRATPPGACGIDRAVPCCPPAGGNRGSR